MCDCDRGLRFGSRSSVCSLPGCDLLMPAYRCTSPAHISRLTKKASVFHDLVRNQGKCRLRRWFSQAFQSLDSTNCSQWFVALVLSQLNWRLCVCAMLRLHGLNSSLFTHIITHLLAESIHIIVYTYNGCIVFLYTHTNYTLCSSLYYKTDITYKL